MKKCGLKGTNVLATIIVGAGVTLIPIADGWAQQKCKQSGKTGSPGSHYGDPSHAFKFHGEL
jgi:hypothetical protein